MIDTLINKNGVPGVMAIESKRMAITATEGKGGGVILGLTSLIHNQWLGRLPFKAQRSLLPALRTKEGKT